MKTNNWNSFSRGLCVALLTISAFCGICGLGAAFDEIPWLLIAGGVCLLLIISAAIWFLGYMSRQVTAPSKETQPAKQVEKAQKPYDQDHGKSPVFDYENA